MITFSEIISLLRISGGLQANELGAISFNFLIYKNPLQLALSVRSKHLTPKDKLVRTIVKQHTIYSRARVNL